MTNKNSGMCLATPQPKGGRRSRKQARKSLNRNKVLLYFAIISSSCDLYNHIGSENAACLECRNVMGVEDKFKTMVHNYGLLRFPQYYEIYLQFMSSITFLVNAATT
uniref:Uncharacterized protein n=1 Tax=Glossina pallidipes TaxID=7398 RepID=A0A1B0ACT1_GLOPL